jgi:hypothetical protein
LKLSRDDSPERTCVAEHASGVITIIFDPTIEVGPITLAWDGITIAIGIVVGWHGRGPRGAPQATCD